MASRHRDCQTAQQHTTASLARSLRASLRAPWPQETAPAERAAWGACGCRRLTRCRYACVAWCKGFVLQMLAARLGIATGWDLAEHCR